MKRTRARASSGWAERAEMPRCEPPVDPGPHPGPARQRRDPHAAADGRAFGFEQVQGVRPVAEEDRPPVAEGPSRELLVSGRRPGWAHAPLDQPPEEDERLGRAVWVRE